MYDLIYNVAVISAKSISVVGVLILVSAASLIALQQIGKNNRSTLEKISNTGERIRQSAFKRIMKTADKHGDDELFDESVSQIYDSYLTNFKKDVNRGFKVVTSCCRKTNDSNITITIKRK